jgi:ComF family protein
MGGEEARSALAALSRDGAGWLLDALLPPQCLACRGPVDRAGRLCAECWRGIDFIAPPSCARCGLPFEFDPGAGALCGACLREPPLFDRAAAVMRYGETSKRLILAFKHADRIEAAPPFGEWLARAGAALIAETELVAPVPLHRWRLLARRYNQAALLAQAVGRIARRPVALDLLRRLRPTPSQGGLDAAQRRRNVRGAFAVRPHWREHVGGRAVLLVDDVMTTGATVEACARALKRAGAARVHVLTLARVVRDGGALI